jgi:hypothetical protein
MRENACAAGYPATAAGDNCAKSNVALESKPQAYRPVRRANAAIIGLSGDNG